MARSGPVELAHCVFSSLEPASLPALFFPTVWRTFFLRASMNRTARFPSPRMFHAETLAEREGLPQDFVSDCYVRRKNLACPLLRCPRDMLSHLNPFVEEVAAGGRT